MVEVAVILPSKDEGETIGDCINKIRKVFNDNHMAGEIVVADNSGDETPVIARQLGAEVITPDGKGYGYAYRYAFKHLKKKYGKYPKYVVMGDADATYEFLEMPRLLEPLEKDEADLVIGSRFKGKIERGAMPWHHRWIGNPLLTWFLNLFYKAGVSDAHSGFRAIKGDALEKLELRAEGMEFASEMIIEAVRKGLRIKEVPISYYKRRNPNSKLSSFSDGWRHLKFMLIHAPDYLFIYPASIITLAGIILMALAFLNVHLWYTPGTHSMIAGSLLTILGYQTLFFGAFARMLEHRSLPKFITLEKGATIGALIFAAGFIWAAKMLLDWMGSGFKSLPPIEQDIACFTLIVIGLQTFFSSFMLSIIAEQRKRWTSQPTSSCP
jgi:glycosyltransferase involved in cell wall biosynthesis